MSFRHFCFALSNNFRTIPPHRGGVRKEYLPLASLILAQRAPLFGRYGGKQINCARDSIPSAYLIIVLLLLLAYKVGL